MDSRYGDGWTSGNCVVPSRAANSGFAWAGAGCSCSGRTLVPKWASHGGADRVIERRVSYL